MVCWPGFADQYTNAKYACEVWGVGVRMDAEIKRETGCRACQGGHGERGDADQRGEVEGCGGGGRGTRWRVVVPEPPGHGQRGQQQLNRHPKA
ncbi:hypothetical protein PR202_gb06867 [Eleusine coracana subsp. coracana]|uniref:Uncharacterized protein n=1 Tax=Eleusine coracana subsp. coracana TaxID=191504 RepID=A0AAV5EA02_ELECO|nr:hypothetical protein PR202_gb06867 [Eleusine coracana subsp. coracana]